MKTILTSYVVFYPDGTTAGGLVDLPERPRFEAIKAIVEPIIFPPGTPDLPKSRPDEPERKWVEHVTVLCDGGRRDLFCDEDFRQRGSPPNPAAHRIYANNTAAQGLPVDGVPPMMGICVLFGRQVWF